MRIVIKGAGVAGLAAAYALATRGFEVVVAEKSATIGLGASYYAGGMLAPWCEGESADVRVVDAGKMSIDWWDKALPGLVQRNGTLVVTSPRDGGELDRFAGRTSHFKWVDEAEIAALEPSLAGRFKRGLYFAEEAHLDPRVALDALYRHLVAMGVTFKFGTQSVHDQSGEQLEDCFVDCSGAGAIQNGGALRGVRGEMLYLQTKEVALSRSVRLLHPRIPLYIVPRADNRFMVGATMIESDDNGPISVRSTMELLNSAYALHPAFGEAKLIEAGSGVRPAYDDNIPQILGTGKNLSMNGMYRHGFLIAPFLAERLARRLSAQENSKEFL